MTPQGSSIFPTAQFDSVIEQLEAVQTIPQLDAVLGLATASIDTQVAAINSQIALLAPIVALADLSVTDLPSVLSFVGDLKTALLGPMIVPAINFPLQLAQFAAQSARLADAAAAAAARIEASV